MVKKVLSLVALCLCVGFSLAQTRIAYCDVSKVLALMPEMNELPNIQKEYELYFSQKLEEKEAAYQNAFKEYLEFAKLRDVEEDDDKKVALENEVVALHNELKYLQEEKDYAFKKIQKDAEKHAKTHFLLVLTALAKEENIEYVLNSPFLYFSKKEIDLTDKVLERIFQGDSSHNLIRGNKN